MSPVDEQAIRDFKRSYWTTAGIGPEYHHCALDPGPITRMKNLVEFSWVRNHVRGPRVLDAGTGTGRFLIALAQADFHPIGLDYSREMLRTAQESFAHQRLTAVCCQGDVFSLPFRDGTFDSVVSITVLRHFPQWRSILREYARVVRTGGPILFELASGEQASLLRSLGATDEVDTSAPINYNAPVTRADIRAIARDLGMNLSVAYTYDIFNDNALLKAIHGSRYDAFLDKVKQFLENNECIAVYYWLTCHVFAKLSPAVSSSWFAVLDGAPSATAASSCTLPPNITVKSIDDLIAALCEDDSGQMLSMLQALSLFRGQDTMASFLKFLDEEFIAPMPGDAWGWPHAKQESP